jgi:hypothetical protein
MAAATSLAIAGVGLLGSGYQAIKGAKDARDAKNALDNYKRQEFQNIAEGMQVSTLGADLQREEQARLAASQVGALQGAGVRGVIGGLGRVETNNQITNRQIGADLDMQQRQIDQMYAQDQANIRGMQEQREYNDIAGLSSQYNAGSQMFQQGLGGLGQTAMAGLSTYGKYLDSKKTNGDNNNSSLFDLNRRETNTNPADSSNSYLNSMNSIFNKFGTSNQNQIPANIGTFVQGQAYSPNQFYNPQNNN